MQKKLLNQLVQIFINENSPILPLKTTVAPIIKKLPGLKALIFDIYGTLFISGSGDISVNATTTKKLNINNILKNTSLKITTPNLEREITSLFKKAIKKSHSEQIKKGNLFHEVEIREIWKEVLNTLIKQKKLSGSFDDETIAIFAVRYENAKNPVWPMPNLKNTLELLQRKNITLGIISNAQFYTPLMFNAFLNKNIYDIFKKELTILSFEQHIAKPSELLFQKLAQQLEYKFSIAPNETLYIGNDIYNDIMPAVKIGFKTALFAGDSRSLRLRKDMEICKNITPDIIITDLSALPPLTINHYFRF